MKILISGSSGFLGSAIVPYFENLGHTVSRLIRVKRSSQKSIFWDPARRIVDKKSLEGFDVVIHLSGHNIAGGRWTKSMKERIYESRVRSTEFLCRTIADVTQKPHTLLSSSAPGYYGDRGEEILTENSYAGKSFLSRLCLDWENATKTVQEAGVRVVHMRIGMVLDPQGGALAKMLPSFKLGLGGQLGHGRQFMSWIALDDILAGIRFCIEKKQLRGPVNFVAPQPTRNVDFTRILASAIRRPAFLSMPSLFAKILFGQMADEVLLASSRVEPKKLTDHGFEFQHPELKPYLTDLLKGA